MPADQLSRAVQTFLPEDVLLSARVPLGFDPQMDAVSKTYCYRLWRDKRAFLDVTSLVPFAAGFRPSERRGAVVVKRHNFVSFRAGSSKNVHVRFACRVDP